MRLDAEAEARILAAVRTGGPAERETALGDLLDAIGTDLRAICRHVAGDRTDGEDAFQETLIAVYYGLPAFRGGSRLTTWIWRIAIRAAIRARARRTRPRTTRLPPGLATPGRETVDALADSERLAYALSTLGADHRAVLVMSAVDGCSGEQIAAVLGVPVGTIWSRIHHARAKLQQALARQR